MSLGTDPTTMSQNLLLLLCPLVLLILFMRFDVSNSINVIVSNVIINITDPNFVSYTIDMAQIDENKFNVSDPRLIYLTSQFDGGYLRIGGTDGDYTYYKIGDENPCNLPINQSHNYYCLSMDRFEEYINFALATNSKLVFGLSMGYPLYPQENTSWNSSNTHQFLLYLHDIKRYGSSEIYGFELGNELNHDPYFNISYQSNAFFNLRKIIDNIWGSNNNIKLFGCDPHSYTLHEDEYDFNYIISFIRKTCSILDGITYHSYINKNKSQLLTSSGLNEQFIESSRISSIWTDPTINEQNENCHNLLNNIWADEIAEHDAQGAPKGLLNTYYDGFWYLDALGTISNLGHAVFARQCLADAGYGLIDEYFNPYPDYYTGLLFNNLMSNKVIKIQSDDEKLRIYAHCTKNGKNNSITMAFININKREITFKYDDFLLNKENIYIWFLTPGNQTQGLSSNSIALNGNILQINKNGKLPSLQGQKWTDNIRNEIKIPKQSYGFIMFNSTLLSVCQ